MLLNCLLVVCFFNQVTAQQNTPVALTPPMGWNSYNCYGSAVYEDEVKANADYMAKYLKPFGWQYIVVDFLWSYDNPPGSNIGNPFQKQLEDGSYIPWLSMDAYGRLLPNANKFPSAFGAAGFKPLSNYIHAAGLQFGIHVMRGIPRQAVWAKSPVPGTNGITADMIADTTSKCDWLNHMYGLDMKKPGAQEYLNSLLKLYVEWGVDFIKVDDLSRPYSTAEVEGYNKAIAQCGRAMVLSLSPGETPINQATHVAKYSNMWRVANDFWDNWEEVLKMFDYAKQWEGTGGPGHWPDCDMMQLGKLSKRGPVGKERYSKFSEDEAYTHITFWSIYQSPLMLGGNLPDNRDFELSLLTNEEVLKANQQGVNPTQLLKKDGRMIWMSAIPDSKDIYLAMFNISDTILDVSVDFASLRFMGKVAVRNLWTKKVTGIFKNRYKQIINPHGAAMFRMSPED